ncbi:anti-repressor SinI family protein [Alteribacter populi]|nr:anti-repressor SinI family protein [Alteribacter populi]
MVVVQGEQQQSWDKEWEKLIQEAREIGLSKEEIRSFLNKQVHKHKTV